MNNEKRDYKRILIICILVAAICLFAFLIVFKLFIENSDFSDSNSQSTEQNYDWANITNDIVTETSEYNPQTEIADNSDQEQQIDNSCDPDSTAIRSDFTIVNMPENIQALINIEAFAQQIQETIYEEGFYDYSTAIYIGAEESEDKVEIWLSIEAAPANLEIDALCYYNDEEYIIRPNIVK